MKKPSLVVMAAGMGSRYGGLKQLDPVGPNGEFIIDYSLYDAIKAGFSKVVFIVKEELQQDFHNTIGKRISSSIETSYVAQKLENLPQGIQVPRDRVKPWGTAHAVLCCKDKVDTPFAVINSDDFYGASTYKVIYDYLETLSNIPVDSKDNYNYCMAGYILENTLTDHGHVARGICKIDRNGHLQEIKERTHIKKIEGLAKYTEDHTHYIDITAGSIVSMNTWGFTPSIFKEIEARFPIFLEQNVENLLNAEFFLSSMVDILVSEKRASVNVLTSQEQWYGVTYKEDKAKVKAAIEDMVEKGIYPNHLWKS